MTVIGGNSNALFFNGVSDAVVVPQAAFERTGLKFENGARSSGSTTGQAGGEYKRNITQVLTSFTIEAWVAPDHGGVIAVKPDLFELRIGGVGEPAPASFSVHVRDDKTGKKTFTAESAVPVVVGGSRVGWDGLVYPRDGATFMQSGTSLNEGSRELLHVVGTFDGKQVKIYVNAELVASVKLDKIYELKMNENDLYIGGRGGEYRGFIESVHWRRGTSEQIRSLPLLASTDSIGLWRFEEPVDVNQDDFYIASNVTAGATTINIGAAGAQTLYETITGKDKSTFTTTLNVATDHGLGNYQVATPTGLQSIGHTPFNLMINPTLCDHKIGKANLSPPERVRLLNVATNGDLTVNSIHLDFGTHSTGARGVLHNRTAFVTATNLANDSLVVLVSGDLLVDSGTGTPYRSPGIGTQMIDRTGQMVIDESGSLNHGVLFGNQMSIGKAKNPFDATSWPSAFGDKFKEGHTARHKYSHRTGHSFMRVFPPAQGETVTKTVDGASDVFDVVFEGQSIGLKDQVPVSTIVNLHRRAFTGPISSVKSSSTANAIVENGHNATATSAEHKREIIAIGGANLDVRPFLLKGHAADSILSTDNVYDLHLAPETESRIAVLEVPSLAPNAAPYVQIHYNAIDLTGSKMGVATPMLLIEKTVPAGGSVIGGSSVAAHIAAAVGAGLTIHAPGGMMRISESVAGDSNESLKPHRLVGDNTGGRLYEIELDESRIPANYTPVRATDEGCKPPQGVDSSHSNDPVHPSVYNRVILQARNRGLPDPPAGEAPTYFRQKPAIDNVNTSGAFDIGAANQSSHIHEVFDIIDNYRDRNEHVLIVQPSNRKRTMQLAKAAGATEASNDATHISVEYLQARGRITGFNTITGGTGRTLLMDCRGLMDDINVSADTFADGSPDSHSIKEIMPGAPVVTVTLGGPGQGAVNTKPTFDPSPLSRLGGTTRRDCSTSVVSVVNPGGGANIEMNVAPLNNNNPGLASWGTYCFPQRGRVYTTGGASAYYGTKQGTKFLFDHTTQVGTGKFRNADGSEEATFLAWITTNEIVADSILVADPDFTQSICADGSSVNDRLFQSLRSVNHDYQLGTQYASTRALVEIPLFPYHFFENREEGIFPGPDNSMALILDATMTAHSWTPNPVGRRCNDYAASDREIMGSYHFTWINEKHNQSTVMKGEYDSVNHRINLYIGFLFPESSYTSKGTGNVRGMDNTLRKRRAFLPNGEWCYYTNHPQVDGYIQLDTSTTNNGMSGNFLNSLKPNTPIKLGGWDMDESLPIIADDGYTTTTSQEFRNPYYYDRANVMTQGGNSDYGLRQYVSAVEFRAGPRENPHGARIESGCAQLKVTRVLRTAPTQVFMVDRPELITHSAPNEVTPVAYYGVRNERTGQDYAILAYPNAAIYGNGPEFTVIQAPWDSTSSAPATGVVAGDVLTVHSLRKQTMTKMQEKIEDGIVNSTWHNPFAPGGLRQGDTVWMNMHYTNPHAMEGIFAKSRGVYNEFEVWSGFNEGRSKCGHEARDTVYMENFLIGNDCLTTARNYAQHVNKTIALNWANLGHNIATAPIIAYVDPYLSTQQHARVLLYDVAHDREAVAFQDLWMQVQSSQRETKIRNLDVANGFRTQRRNIPYSYGGQTKVGSVAGNYDHMVASVTDIGGSSPAGVDTMLTTSGKSEFMESAYAHRSWYYVNAKFNDTLGAPNVIVPYITQRQAPNYILVNDDETEPCPVRGGNDRTNNSVCCPSYAKDAHARTLQKAITDSEATAVEATKVWTENADAYPFQSTMFDTPEGTRAIPAFLALRGNRSTSLSLTSHKEQRLQHLPHWTHMDFVRRLRLDLGEVGVKEGVTDIEAAAQEVVRLVNQAGALNGRSNQRRPADQYPGESERFDITRQGTNVTAHTDSNQESDPTAAHHGADFAITGSTHDPAPFWDDTAYSSFDRGSHMGYLRAHVGRVVEDADGVEGFSVVIHATVPGATGRNFCVWLDNSRAQSAYRPQFLVGHGGRFRNFWCQPNEILAEMMHPAPMPINKHGRPYAPITSLKGLTHRDEPSDYLTHNSQLGASGVYNGGGVPSVSEALLAGQAGTLNNEIPTGRSSNTTYNESFEQNTRVGSLVEGLRVGTRARARINCGGLVAAGIPGWAPDAGKWGFGIEGGSNNRWNTQYGPGGDLLTYSTYVPATERGDDIGDTPLYGFRLVDHIGRRHTLRMLYKQYGISFANDNTRLPPSLDNEVVIWFDDRDVGSGGFTIGDHMWGKGDPTNRISHPLGGPSSVLQSWKGNEFRGGETIQATYAVSIDTPPNDTVLELNKAAGVGYAADGIWHDLPAGVDALGHLGFPDSGMIWVCLPDTVAGITYTHAGYVLHYTHRTHNAKGGQHSFYGVSGQALTTLFANANTRGPTSLADAQSPLLISPMLNPTTILTDEVIAGAIEYAMSIDPNDASVDETSFDCTGMYAPDGRTFGEWGIKPTSIRVKAYSEKQEVMPLKDLFEVDRRPDWSLYAGSIDVADVNSFVGGSTGTGHAEHNTHIGGLTRTEVNSDKRLDIGYVPKTVLHITTRYRGTNANTATPVIIDSQENVIDTSVWRANLRGERYTRYPGDHITPAIENPVFHVTDTPTAVTVPPAGATVAGNIWTLTLEQQPTSGDDPGMSLHWLSPVGRTKVDASTGAADFGGAADLSYAPLMRVCVDDKNSFVGEPKAGRSATGSFWSHSFVVDDRTGVYSEEPKAAVTTTDLIKKVLPGPNGSWTGARATISRFASIDRVRVFDGARLAGGLYTEPIVYFRGALDSIDHHVPLYFGGGFSGVVLDINDGTENDYSEFYKHPYSTGPTGTAGIQHANEMLGSHALLDTTAMLAMFPGTALLNQHEGEVGAPFANQQMVLSPDMDGQANDSAHASTGFDDPKGAGNSYGTGTANSVDITRPSPLILRFAHPHARYKDEPSSSNDHTTYVIFGPGQSFPKHWKGEDTEQVEPNVRHSVAPIDGTLGSVGHAWGYNITAGAVMYHSTRYQAFLPNEISNFDGQFPAAAPALMRFGSNQFLPPPREYIARNIGGWKHVPNWDPAHGAPNLIYNKDNTSHVLWSCDPFYNPGTGGVANPSAHPFYPYMIHRLAASSAIPIHGTTAGAPSEDLGGVTFHMDGGYAPGGHFFDNCIRLNPPHPVTGRHVASKVVSPATSKVIGDNATIYRGCAAMLPDYDKDLALPPDTEIIVIDATRVQNSEELGAVIAGSINAFPGKGALKALGGTFAPSFGSAHQQDRYSWIEMGPMGAYTTAPAGTTATSGHVQVAFIPESTPAYGWIRIAPTTPDPGDPLSTGYYAFYYGIHIDKANNNYAFLLGPNQRTTETAFEDPMVTQATCAKWSGGAQALAPPANGAGFQVYVWSKAGNLRWSNGVQDKFHSGGSVYGDPASWPQTNTIYDHLAATQVHFSGIVNAVDRTRPIGAIGWHGERYSYLNSLEVANPDGTNGVGAGKGAWHAFLSFNPYGSSMVCHNKTGGLISVDVDSSNNKLRYTPVADCPHGVHPSHYVVISHEAELPLVAKFDRNGVSCTGDLLAYRWGDGGSGTAAQTGTTLWDADLHSPSRYTAPANGGPNVEALWVHATTPPPDAEAAPTAWHAPVTAGTHLYQMDTCLSPTGDLFTDYHLNPGTVGYYADATLDGESLKRTCAGDRALGTWDDEPWNYWKNKHPARNFATNHVTWKRMDGGSLSLPASNARGLGAIPFITRVKAGVPILTGEKLLGNCRFSFETTNAAMFPVIQAQELAHPGMSENLPRPMRNVLEIPNEEIQFERIIVVDDTGQEHFIEGGSPFGTIIRDFDLLSDRDVEGLAPAEAGSGNSPNMRIRLPDPDTIPGNIIVRSGFDRSQVYQNESIGTGGLQRPGDAEDLVKRSFDNTNPGPRVWPTWENNAWDHIDSDPDNFPDNAQSGWRDTTNDAPLRTSYEPHDRALYFHITKMGHTHTEREPALYHTHAFGSATVDVNVTSNPLTYVSQTTNTIVVNTAIDRRIWLAAGEASSGRWFLSINGRIASYTGVTLPSTFTGVVFTPDFTAAVGDSVKPSFYVPAGSNRFFAARRLRDHAEVSGESPDMPLTRWYDVKGARGGSKSPYELLSETQLTPMPLPRMGHHYVTPTMPMLPGHLAHPVYQRLYTSHYGCSLGQKTSWEAQLQDLTGADWTEAAANIPVRDPLVWFSNLTANYPPSDIHGGAFTLMTETKIRYDGYGILASDGVAGTQNSKGSHLIFLEAAKDYTLTHHFPDPMEVGAYQIVIQPNVYAQQLVGYHHNPDAVSDVAPWDPAAGAFVTRVPFLTGQQVATVIGIDDDNAQAKGGIGLILASAVGADVRGCEIYVNEMMLDIDPSPGQQFTTLPLLATFNPLGVNEGTSGTFTRRSLPYHPNMFRRSTPGYTITIPWWANSLSSPFAASHFKHLEHYHADDYYRFCRSTLGAISSQITLAGYPTHFYDAYTGDYSALSPTCKVISVDSGNARIVVDNNDLFPLVGIDYYNMRLELTTVDNEKMYATYNHRGYTSGGGAGLGTENTSRFETVVPEDATFWAKAVAGSTLRLTGHWKNTLPGEVYTDSMKDVATRNLTQLLHGTRDTNSLHMADAFLVRWHQNLGRPYTINSDSSRPNPDSPAFLQEPLNHLPEFFDMVHYHEFTYAVSNGPFGFRMAAQNAHSDAARTGAAVVPESLHGSNPAEGGTDGVVFHYANFWPGGTRYGASATRLDHWGDVMRGWHASTALKMGDCKTWTTTGTHGTAVTQTAVATLYGASSATYAYHRNFCFGHRFAVRQPYNRPRWAIQGAKGITGPFNFPHNGYQHGPLIQHDIGSWTYEGEGGLADQAITATNVGIMEQQTNASALLGADVRGHQVRYADGRRITAPFGCPVRNIVNPVTAKRLHPGDFFVGKQGTHANHKRDLVPGVLHYIVDWWGNTTGEDVRKYPVRGFGIRPTWDPEDAYALPDKNPTTVKLYRDRSHFTLPSAAEGVDNRTNRGAGSEDLVDWFNPKTAMRVGDRGDGRGVRWPTVFNENVLQAVSIPIRPVGMVLSHHTAEPPFTVGLLRPSNDPISPVDIPVGISRRLGINREDGLLKPEAMSGMNVEQAEANFLTGGAFIQDAISRLSPRIGLDALTVGNVTGDVSRTYMVQGTHATSLHTDRGVGQRYTVAKDYDLTTLDFATNTDDVMKLSLTDGINPLGGSYVLYLDNYMEPVSDLNWGAQLPTSGMVLWLKADAIKGLADGAAVTQWDDSSGNGRNFAQGTASKQPAYIASEANFGNRPAVRFDGGDKLSIAYDAELNTNQFTVFVVAAVNADNNTHEAIYESRSSYDFTLTGISLTNTDATVTHAASPVALVVGMPVSGPGIPGGAEIASITDATHFELTAAATATSVADITVSVVRAGFNLYGDMTGGAAGGFWEMWAGRAESWAALGSGHASTPLVTAASAILTAQISGGNGLGAAATQLFRKDGNELTQACTYYKSTDDFAGIGTMNTSSYMLDGEVAEIIHYNRALSAAEILEVESYLAEKYSIAHTSATRWRTSNPYQTLDHDPFVKRTNVSDKKLGLLLRPVRVLDHRHIEIFRHARRVNAGSPQDSKNYYSATAGGRYGVFVYDTPGARVENYILTAAPAPTNPPYAPVYYVDPAVSLTVPVSTGLLIPGTESAGFQLSLRQTVGRIVVSENTLGHYKSDAARRQSVINQDSEDVILRPDYSVEPRHSQTTHPGTKFNTKDHGGEVSADYSEVNN